MAMVLALSGDLLFGSRVQSGLQSAGHEVELIGDPGRLTQRLTQEPARAADVLVVDLTDAGLDGVGLLEELSAQDALGGMRTLGFYAHVDVDMRERAARAGFEMLVPRSRMAREGGALISRLTRSPRS